MKVYLKEYRYVVDYFRNISGDVGFRNGFLVYRWRLYPFASPCGHSRCFDPRNSGAATDYVSRPQRPISLPLFK